MTIDATIPPGKDKPTGSILNDPKVRGFIYQAVTLLLLIVFIYWIAMNTSENLKRANIASGYGFLNGRAGFDVGQSLIAYSSDSTYGRALVVGFFNTILVAVAGIVTATIIGFSGRHRPAVEELAGRQAVDGLCRSLPQHSAAAGHFLLVFRRSGRPAAAKGLRGVAAGYVYQQSRPRLPSPGV